MLLFHLCTPEHWEAQLDAGIYDHPSRKSEGFIHCSTREQLERTLERHFADATEVVILHLVDRHVKHLLRWEPNAEGELFPHIYGEIELEYIIDVSIGERNPDGSWEPDTLPRR